MALTSARTDIRCGDTDLARVKSLAESQGERDLFKIVGRIPAEAVVWPLAEFEVSIGETLTPRHCFTRR